jgi:DNA-binding MarR family transcriptional regulator
MKRAEIAADELRQILGALTRRLRAESGAHGPSPSEQSAMRRLLDLGPSTTAALARAEMLTPQSMGSTLAALEEGGYVARTMNASDARCRTVSVTDKGRQVLLEGRKARQNWLARAIGEKLDGDEQRTLLDALELLKRVVGS